MPYPFRTRDESRRDRSTDPAPGVRLTFASDVKHFFPGATVETALALAKIMCPANLFEDPGTTIEFGDRLGSGFVLKHHVSGPKLTPKSDWEAPRVLRSENVPN